MKTFLPTHVVLTEFTCILNDHGEYSKKQFGKRLSPTQRRKVALEMHQAAAPFKPLNIIITETLCFDIDGREGNPPTVYVSQKPKA